MEKLLSQHHFTAKEIANFISNALVIKCPKRMILLNEGEVSRFFYYATKGVFRAGFTDKKGNQQTLSFFSPDTTIPFVMSYTSLMYQRPSLCFLEAVEEGEVLAWHASYIRKLQKSDIKWLDFSKSQIDLVLSSREIREWQFYSLTAEERYLAFLEQSPELANQIPLYHIASYIGITPEALSRIRGRLQKGKTNFQRLILSGVKSKQTMANQDCLCIT